MVKLLQKKILTKIQIIMLKKQYVVLPSIEEQKRITENIEKMCEEILVVINEKQKLIATLSDYKKSLIYEYVTGKKEVRHE